MAQEEFEYIDPICKNCFYAIFPSECLIENHDDICWCITNSLFSPVDSSCAKFKTMLGETKNDLNNKRLSAQS